MAGTVSDKKTEKKLSAEIVSMLAARAALRVPGVSRLSTAGNLSRKILGKEKMARGVVLSWDKDGEGICIDIYLNVEYGTKIPSLAWEVQNSVKETVESVTGLKVSLVNIYVQGVNLPKSMMQEG